MATGPDGSRGVQMGPEGSGSREHLEPAGHLVHLPLLAKDAEHGLGVVVLLEGDSVSTEQSGKVSGVRCQVSGVR